MGLMVKTWDVKWCLKLKPLNYRFKNILYTAHTGNASQVQYITHQDIQHIVVVLFTTKSRLNK